MGAGCVALSVCETVCVYLLGAGLVCGLGLGGVLVYWVLGAGCVLGVC